MSVPSFSEEFNATVEALDTAISAGLDSGDMWILIAGFLVFFMHAGFTMLEAGSVQHKNAVNICFKNVGTITIGAIMYWFIGYMFAYGSLGPSFIGTNSDFIVAIDLDGTQATWFFQFAFCATAATIVSGAVAGRINLLAYFVIAAYLTAFVYPVVTHWVWNTGGWLGAFPNADGEQLFGEIGDTGGCGFIDYAGSGVVHMTGGVAAFVFAKVLGPRLGRFDSEGNPVDIPPHNVALQTLGVWILWFGWFGFNCGSTLAWDAPNASNVAVATVLCPAFSVVTVMIVKRVTTGHFEITSALNAALGGLVSITAGCSTLPEYGSVITGIIGGLVYLGGSKLMLKLKVDDPVDAIAVHGVCGAWGCIAVGIFAEKERVLQAYTYPCAGRGGTQFGTQIIGVLVILAWVSATTLPVAIAMKATGFLRVSEESETIGLDASEHNASGFVTEKTAKVASASA